MSARSGSPSRLFVLVRRTIFHLARLFSAVSLMCHSNTIRVRKLLASGGVCWLSYIHVWHYNTVHLFGATYQKFGDC
jgi:hypothetical protein